MKITYLTLGQASAGVDKKLSDKTYSLREVGLDVHLTIVGVDKGFVSETVTKLEVSQTASRKLGRFFFFWRLSVVLEQWALYKAALIWVRSHPADLILFRYPVSDFFLWRFMRKCNQRIVFEYNTIELVELNLRRKGSFYFQYFYWSERIFGKMVRSRSTGIIGVTQEIADYQSGLVGSSIPAVSISNGINVARLAQPRDVVFDGSELRIVLLAGAQAQWHGVDILLRALFKIEGRCKIKCFLIGQITASQKEFAEKLPHVTVLDNQLGSDLSRLMNQCHLGIGSLGFESGFLTQACPLKVREYWARGLPFVIAYEDSDLINNREMDSFCFKAEIVNGQLDIDKIVDFAKRVYSIKNYSIRMQELASKQIDYRVKALQYLSFINSLPK